MTTNGKYSGICCRSISQREGLSQPKDVESLHNSKQWNTVFLKLKLTNFQIANQNAMEVCVIEFKVEMFIHSKFYKLIMKILSVCVLEWRRKSPPLALKNFCSIFSTCAIHYVKNTRDWCYCRVYQVFLITCLFPFQILFSREWVSLQSVAHSMQKGKKWLSQTNGSLFCANL